AGRARQLGPPRARRRGSRARPLRPARGASRGRRPAGGLAGPPRGRRRASGPARHARARDALRRPAVDRARRRRLHRPRPAARRGGGVVRRALERFDPRVSDGLLGLAFAIAAAIEIATKDGHRGPLGLNIAAVFVVYAPWIWRRRAPLAAGLAYGAGAIAMTATLEYASDVTAILIGLLVISYSVGAHARLRPALTFAACAGGIVVAVDAVSHQLG